MPYLPCLSDVPRIYFYWYGSTDDWVCFGCRKRVHSGVIYIDTERSDYKKRAQVCKDCHNRMTERTPGWWTMPLNES